MKLYIRSAKVMCNYIPNVIKDRLYGCIDNAIGSGENPKFGDTYYAYLGKYLGDVYGAVFSWVDGVLMGKVAIAPDYGKNGLPDNYSDWEFPVEVGTDEVINTEIEIDPNDVDSCVDKLLGYWQPFYDMIMSDSIESSTDICADSNGSSVRIHLNTDICPIIIPDTYGTEFQYKVDEDMRDDFKQLMMDKAYDYIKEALDDIGIPYSNLTVDQFGSPQYYNYSTDWIDFSFDVPSNIVEIMESEIDDDFFDYTENKFGSHQGFISSMPYTKAKFIKSDDLDRKVAMYVMYKFSQAFDADIYEQEYLDSVYDYASENGYLIDYYDE